MSHKCVVGKFNSGSHNVLITRAVGTMTKPLSNCQVMRLRENWNNNKKCINLFYFYFCFILLIHYYFKFKSLFICSDQNSGQESALELPAKPKTHTSCFLTCLSSFVVNGRVVYRSVHVLPWLLM